MLGRNEKTINLMGVNRARAFTMLYINGIHNINILHIMFSLKAPLFKGGWGGSNAIKHSHRKNTLLLRDFLENGKKCNRTGVTTMRSQPMFQNHKYKTDFCSGGFK
ncbi:hypothetical protein CENA302_00925 [Cylindrospermopsis raciborskii CENA302]|uniref:Uncharacterized protein n=1 Tax=Cylindrospermopsis raciborskii CENA302 TaxID=1170768 RepID=A0A9Q5QZH0_9CYAN|nr:hypothetical protein CENA302_00925 [Cylindrospermopsis raciborskii CENA302]